MSDKEYETEPIPGLPELPPEGERILWQGRPSWIQLAIRALHVRTVAIYFAALILVRAVSMAGGAHSGAAIAADAVFIAAIGLVAMGILTLIAWLSARMTVYTITSKRLVIRHGIALPMTLNIPFKVIASAGLRTYSDGTGDIPLALNPGIRIAFLALWPHARPWRLREPQPMLRAVPHATTVAETLGHALAAVAGQAQAAPAAARTEDRTAPAGHALPGGAIAAA